MIIVVKDNTIERYVTLSGIPNIKVIYTEKIDTYNTLVIDESFRHDIILSFPNYIFNVFKIINGYTISKRDKVFQLNYDYYNAPITKDYYKDLIILRRKDNYEYAHVPNIAPDGKIRIIQLKTSDIGEKTITWSNKVNDYMKLRTIIFNETILPYIRQLIL